MKGYFLLIILLIILLKESKLFLFFPLNQLIKIIAKRNIHHVIGLKNIYHLPFVLFFLFLL